MWVGLGFFLLNSALAGEEGVLENVTVTGSNIPTDGSLLPATVEILDNEVIEARADGNLVDLFQGLAGIDVVQHGGDGGVTSIFMRGGDPNFTAILIDGVKVNDPTNSRGGAFDFSNIDPALIERVEILRGPGSAVMGSDALSGAINIIAKRARGQAQTLLGGSYATDDGFTLSFSHLQPIGFTTDLSLGASYAQGGDSVEGNELERLNLHMGGGSALSDRLNVRAGLYYSSVEAQNFPQDSGGPRLAVLRDLQTRDGAFLSGFFKADYALSDTVQIKAYYSLNRSDETVFSPAIAPGVLNPVPSFTTISHYQRDEFSLNGLYRLGDVLRLNVGVAYSRESGGDDGFIDFGFPLPADFSLSRATRSLYGEIRLNMLKSCILSASSRLDDADALKADMSFKAGVECGLDDHGSLVFATGGQGFKLPSFFALGHPLVGNAALRPERSESVEAGFRQAFRGGEILVDLRYFHTIFTDLVDLDFETFKSVNRSRVKAEGVEASLVMKAIAALDVNLGVSYTKTEIINSTEKLRHRPRWKGNLGLTWRMDEKLTAHLYAFFSGSFFDSSIATGLVEMKSYQSVDLSLIRKIGTTSRLKLSLKNLLNTDYEQLIGFPAAGWVGRISYHTGF